MNKAFVNDDFVLFFNVKTLNNLTFYCSVNIDNFYYDFFSFMFNFTMLNIFLTIELNIYSGT